MPAVHRKLIDPGVCIVFAYAPAGLGHLRVTDALYHGLPSECKPTLLPDTALSVHVLHRITSSNPLAKTFFEWSQHGVPEDIITKAYRFLLHRDAHVMKQRLLDVLKQQITLPHTFIIVATHYGIAHQVSVIKKEIETLGNVRVLLVVQVTDDSPQKLWYVPFADLLFTPSHKTTDSLLTYGRLEQLGKSRVITNPYPVSPRLTERNTEDYLETRLNQTNPHAHALIHIAIPISGAAVGMSYMNILMKQLHQFEPRVRFHVVVKKTLYTVPFLRLWNKKEYIHIYQSRSDRQIVDIYEQVYENQTITFEITKPSEQSFKALIPPTQKGGTILLFAPAVGRQEYDNLNFLQRHGLIPTDSEYTQLCDVLNLEQEKLMPLPLSSWRGFSLPHDPKDAAKWMSRGLSLRIFQSMIHWKQDKPSDEVSPDGVSEFWKQVNSLL